MRSTFTFDTYTFVRDQTGSYHRVLSSEEYEKILLFYKTHIYIGGEFHTRSILSQATTQLATLATYDGPKAEGVMNALKMRLTQDVKHRLLDVGCGFGAFLVRWRDFTGQHAVGVDMSCLSPLLSQRLWDRPPRIHSGQLPLVLSEPELTAEDGWPLFTLITAVDIVEHLWEPQTVLRKLREILTQGGLLFVECPIIPVDASWTEVTKLPLFYPEHHLHQYTERGLVQLARKNGFRLCSVGRGTRAGKMGFLFRSDRCPPR